MQKKITLIVNIFLLFYNFSYSKRTHECKILVGFTKKRAIYENTTTIFNKTVIEGNLF